MLTDGYPFGDTKLTLTFATDSEHHPLLAEKMEITKQDIDTPLGSELEDERYTCIHHLMNHSIRRRMQKPLKHGGEIKGPGYEGRNPSSQ